MKRPITINENQFDFRPDHSGTDSLVATVQVPRNRVWAVDTGQPLVLNLVAHQTHTIASDATESVSLDPEAPVLDYEDDVSEAEYSTSANVVIYDGDTLVTDTTDVQFTGTVSTGDDYIQSVELEETASSETELDIYTVSRHGLVTLQKRNAGSGNVTQDLQSEDAVSLAFQNPDAPDTDRQVTWDRELKGRKGIFPPKFKLDITYYDANYTVALDPDGTGRPPDDYNIEISLPVNQRKLKPDEDPAQMRRKIESSMTGR